METDSNGNTVTINSITPKGQGYFLQKIYDKIKPEKSLEVGFAFGISTLFILEKCLEHKRENGCHIVIEPFDWGNAAIYNIQKAGLEKYIDIRKELSDRVLPAMYLRNERIQFAYVDTTKVFDIVLQDFYFIDKILDIGGVVIFDDATTQGINLVMRFIKSLPHYEVFDKYEKLEVSKKYLIGERIFEKLIEAVPFKKRFMSNLSLKTSRELALNYRCIAFKKIDIDKRNWDWQAPL
ncbi:MAG TPA: class I SAM-dependent methyltransferase [Hanamia sp.]|nr:class I SAM-dependent methyltransferase [Hanamia sp.]